MKTLAKETERIKSPSTLVNSAKPRKLPPVATMKISQLINAIKEKTLPIKKAFNT